MRPLSCAPGHVQSLLWHTSSAAVPGRKAVPVPSGSSLSKLALTSRCLRCLTQPGVELAHLVRCGPRPRGVACAKWVSPRVAQQPPQVDRGPPADRPRQLAAVQARGHDLRRTRPGQADADAGRI